MKLSKGCESKFNPEDVGKVLGDTELGEELAYLCDSDNCNLDVDFLLELSRRCHLRRDVVNVGTHNLGQPWLQTAPRASNSDKIKIEAPS